MDPRKLFVDQRQCGYCVYCGGPSESDDHVPSKALLDEPYPRDLPTVDACERCNNGFSLDEEYLAVFIECTIVGSTDPERQSRPSIRRKLTESPSLRALIQSSRTQKVDGTLEWRPDEGRVENVLTKLARGHIAFEEGTPRLDEPGVVDFVPLVDLPSDEANGLLAPWPIQQSWPEIGSRAFFRASGMKVPHNPGPDGWITIQPGRYRYRVNGNTVQVVLSEYLCCTILWD
jgi:hypothetical protein